MKHGFKIMCIVYETLVVMGHFFITQSFILYYINIDIDILITLYFYFVDGT